MPVNEREVKKKDMECSRRGRERSLTETVAEGKKTLRGGKQRGWFFEVRTSRGGAAQPREVTPAGSTSPGLPG